MLLKHGLAGLGYKAAAGGGLITSGLVAQYEMDNTTAPTTTTWRDEISSRDLSDTVNVGTPQIISGGTPTGQDYYEFATADGLEAPDITGWGWPQDAEARTMFAVARWPTGGAHNFEGVGYGDGTTLEAWGLGCNASSLLISDHWANSVAGSAVNDATWHVVANSYDTADVRLYLDDVLDGGPTTVSLATSGTGRATICESIALANKPPLDVAAWLIYDRVLTGTEMTQMYNYLNDKYVTV